MAARVGAEPGQEGGMELVCRYASQVYRFAAMAAKGDLEAEDLAQEALARALAGVASFDPQRGSMENWLWRIVVNAGRDSGRLANRRRLLWDRLAGLAAQPESAETLALDRLADAELLAAIRRLPKPQRTMIALRYGADLDYRTIARLLRMTPGAATIATRRALARLRGLLEGGKK